MVFPKEPWIIWESTLETSTENHMSMALTAFTYLLIEHYGFPASLEPDWGSKPSCDSSARLWMGYDGLGGLVGAWIILKPSQSSKSPKYAA